MLISPVNQIYKHINFGSSSSGKVVHQKQTADEFSKSAEPDLGQLKAQVQSLRGKFTNLSHELGTGIRESYPQEYERIPEFEAKITQVQRELGRLSGRIHEIETQAKFDKIKDKINPQTTVNVLNKATGEPVEIKIQAEKGGYADYSLKAYDGEKVIGRADVYLNETCDFPSVILPENYLKGAKYSKIKIIGASNEYKGVGSELVRAIVRNSEKAGNGGRVVLKAYNGNDLPFRFSPTTASPVPFYKKLGFAFYNYRSTEKKIMYLTDEGIARITGATNPATSR